MIIRPATIADWGRIAAAAAADGQGILPPSYYAEADGEIVGYSSIGRVGLATGWSCTKNTPRQSFICIRHAIDAMRKSSSPVFFLCETNSPLNPFLPKMGLVKVGNADFFKLES
jgi:hypothetical protein